MGLSRNKVAVPEGAAGSPPFYGVLWGARVGCLFVGWLVARPCGWGSSLLVWKRSWIPPVWVGVVWCVLLGSRTATPPFWWGVWFRAHGSCAVSVGVVRGLWCGGGLRTGEWTRAAAMPFVWGVVGVRTVNEPRRIGLIRWVWLVWPGCIPAVCGGVCVRSFVSCRPCPCWGVVDVCDDLIVECSSWTHFVFFVVCSRRLSLWPFFGLVGWLS